MLVLAFLAGAGIGVAAAEMYEALKWGRALAELEEAT
jgi:hypothetical protein